MRRNLFLMIVCILPLNAMSQTVSDAMFNATVYAQQKMTDNTNPLYLVNWTTDSEGNVLDNDKAPITDHLTTLNIDASAISWDVESISIFANNKKAIAGSLYFNGKRVIMSAGDPSNVYVSSGQSDVLNIVGSDKTCTAYLLPNTLSNGVRVNVHTTDGRFYTQNFPDAITAGETKTLTLTETTANNLWMSTIPGCVYFCFVSTPCAHDATTSGVESSIAKCQGEDLQTLLANGVRGFDLRPNYMNSTTITADNLYIYHSYFNTNVKYVDAMKIFVEFLKANPSEAISVVMVKEKGDGDTDRSSEMWNVINSCHSGYGAYMKLLNSNTLTLDDFRGKICYINRTGTNCTNTTRITNWPDDGNITDYSAAMGNACFANIQDKYNTNGTDKQDEIKSMLQTSSSNTEKSRFHYNFCSSAWSWFGTKDPAGYAAETNPVIATYLNDGNISGPTGYVYADFIGSSSNGGADLLSAIVNQNYRYVYLGMSKEEETGVETVPGSRFQVSSSRFQAVPGDIYDLSGRWLTKQLGGINIVKGHKVLRRK